jgi:hypothetical protein
MFAIPQGSLNITGCFRFRKALILNESSTMKKVLLSVGVQQRIHYKDASRRQRLADRRQQHWHGLALRPVLSRTMRPQDMMQVSTPFADNPNGHRQKYLCWIWSDRLD